MKDFFKEKNECVCLIENMLNGNAKACKNKIELFSEIDSTNTYLKNIASQNAPHASVAIAESQTNGRGRLGRSFYSPNKTGVYLSLLYKTSEQITKPALFTAASAVAVSRAVKKLCNIDLQIKWVNDLYLAEQKVCGILCEGVPLECEGLKTIIIGIGVNIFTTSFPKEIENKAGSLFNNSNCAGGAEYSGGAGQVENVENVENAKNVAGDFNKIDENTDFRLVLAAEILNQLFECFEANNFENVLSEYKEKSFILGKNVEVISPNGNYFAKAVEISNDAELIVQKLDGTKATLNSGEISIKPQK